jgi:uncharacterized repeat protein (TIGR01451 family)
MARTAANVNFLRNRRRRIVAARSGFEPLEPRALLATLTVNSTLDAVAPDTVLTLREAISLTNGNLDPGSLSPEELAQITGDLADPNTIGFDVPGGGVPVIQPMSALPVIIRPVTIDGLTQPGTGSSPRVEISGISAGAGSSGLVIEAGASTITGLAINRFSAHGIDIQTVGGNTIRGNVIGSDAGATTSLPNGGDGVRILNASNNIIGGVAPGQSNTIAFSGGSGVNVIGGNGNAIRGNSMFQNTGPGIALAVGANNNINSPSLRNSITTAGTTTIRGDYTGLPSASYTIDYYSATTLSTATTAQGRTYLGSQTVTTSTSGAATLQFTPSTPVPISQYIVATATSLTDGTSIFSNPVLNSTPTSDVSISGVATPSPAVQGGYLTYVFTVRNAGPSAADVTFTNTLPSSVSFVEATSSVGTVSRLGSTTTVDLGNMGPDATATVTIRVVPTTVGTIANTATVTATGDTDTSNNTATVNVSVQQGINLVVATQALPDPSLLTETIAYRFIVQNTGPITATGATFTADLPAGLTLVSSSTTQGSTSTTATGISAALGSLASGSSAIITVFARPTSVGTFSITGRASGDQGEINPPDNTATLSATVIQSFPPSPGSNTPPTVSNLSRFGYHAQTTSFQLSFSEQLDPATAANRLNYRVATAGRDGRFGTRDDVSVPIRLATYNSATRAVILTTRGRVNWHVPVQVTVTGTAPSGVRSLAGVLLDGAGNGKPGSNYVAIIRGFDQALPAARARPSR